MAYKYITPEQKLLLIVIGESEVDVPPFVAPSTLTSQEMANKLGATRTTIQTLLWEMTELDLLITKLENRTRYTSITARCKRLIKKTFNEATTE